MYITVLAVYLGEARVCGPFLFTDGFAEPGRSFVMRSFPILSIS